MRRILTIAALFAATSPTWGDDNKTAIELQLRLNKRPSVQAKTKPIPYEEAKKLAEKTGQPVFISVRLNCKNCCGELRTAGYLTVHADVLYGDSTPRAILAIPSKGELYFGKQWNALPSPDDVKRAYGEWKTAHPNMTDAADLKSAAAMLAVLVTGVENLEWTESTVQYQQVCGPNGCTMVPVGYTAMPSGDGPYTVAVGDGFQADFPTVARGRRFIRRLVGRVFRRPVQEPAVRGQFVQAALPATVPGGDVVAGGPLRRLVLRHEIQTALRQALTSAPLTAEQHALATRLLNDPNLYELAVSTAKLHLDRKGVYGRLGDGTLFQRIVDSLPAIFEAVAKFLKELGVI